MQRIAPQKFHFSSCSTSHKSLIAMVMPTAISFMKKKCLWKFSHSFLFYFLRSTSTLCAFFFHLKNNLFAELNIYFRRMFLMFSLCFFLLLVISCCLPFYWQNTDIHLILSHDTGKRACECVRGQHEKRYMLLYTFSTSEDERRNSLSHFLLCCVRTLRWR